MDLNKYPTLHPQVAARVIDGSAIVVLTDAGAVNVLNAVGTRVWELIDGKRTCQAIIDTIVAEYNVAPAQAQQDVETFLQQLMQVRAVELKTQP